MKNQSSLAAIRSHFSRQAATYNSQAIVQNLTRTMLINFTIPWLYNHFSSLHALRRPLSLKFADLGAGSNLNFTYELWQEFESSLLDLSSIVQKYDQLVETLNSQWENILSPPNSSQLLTQNVSFPAIQLDPKEIILQGSVVDLVELEHNTTLIQEQFQSRFKELWLQSHTTPLNQWCATSTSKDYDLIFSNACFQWLSQPQEFLNSLKNNILSANGTIIFSTFSVANLQELRNLGLPGLFYYTRQEWLKMLENAGFKVEILVHSKITLYFTTLKELFRHLKETGVNGITTKHKWTKRSYSEFLQQYHQQFYIEEKGYPLTYHPVLIVART